MEEKFNLPDDAGAPPTIGLHRHRRIVSEEPSLFTPWLWPYATLGAMIVFSALLGLILLPQWIQAMKLAIQYFQ